MKQFNFNQMTFYFMLMTMCMGWLDWTAMFASAVLVGLVSLWEFLGYVKTRKELDIDWFPTYHKGSWWFILDTVVGIMLAWWVAK